MKSPWKTLIPLICMLTTLGSCSKNVRDLGQGAENPLNMLTLNGNKSGAKNLLANGDLSQWSTDSKRLMNWEMTTASPGVITMQKNAGLTFSGSMPGAFYIYQRIPVESGQFYMASLNAGYDIHNYFSCGLYIMDSNLRSIIGKFERTYSAGQGETWNVLFRPDAGGQVAVVLGFLNGINAAASFQNVSVKTFDYQPTIDRDGLAMHLGKKYHLEFSPAQFDSTVCKIADYVNSVLLCKYTYLADTVELPILDPLIGNDPGYSYFNTYRGMVDQLPVAYCQKSSLSLAEILSNEYHVPTRQVHMVFGDEGRHQFTEYWNPFAGKWIAIDPCFNTQYTRNGALAGVKDFDRSEARDRMTLFGTYIFHSFLPYDLSWYWENMDGLMITDYYTMTFPYPR